VKEVRFTIMLTPEALTFAEYDIKSNWRIYKQQFLRGIKDGNTSS